jgi:hypothetical protein
MSRLRGSDLKLTINVECSPEEARRFMGFPDVSPLNDMIVGEMSRRVQENMALLSPDTMIRSWMAAGGQAQDAFMKLMTSAATGATRGFSGE